HSWRGAIKIAGHRRSASGEILVALGLGNLCTKTRVLPRNADFPVCCIAGFPTCERDPAGRAGNLLETRCPSRLGWPAGWESGDTAGLEACGTCSVPSVNLP